MHDEKPVHTRIWDDEGFIVKTTELEESTS